MTTTVKRTFKQWLKWYFPRRFPCFTGREMRYQTKRGIRLTRELDRLENSLVHCLATWPAGFERRQVNNDLLKLRMMRTMKGL